MLCQSWLHYIRLWSSLHELKFGSNFKMDFSSFFHFFWFGGILGSAARAEFPVSLSNHVGFTPRLLYSSTHHSAEIYTHLKTGWAGTRTGISILTSAADIFFLFRIWFFEKNKKRNIPDLIVFEFLHFDYRTWHFPILTLSDSDTFQFWHFPILTLSDSDTFQFWRKMHSETFQFWHCPVSRTNFPLDSPLEVVKAGYFSWSKCGLEQTPSISMKTILTE